MFPNPISQQKQRARQNYMKVEKERKIEKENQLLFEKIVGTYKKRNCSTTPQKYALNYRNRKEFQKQITDENQKIFTRIKQQKSYYKIQTQPKSLSKQRANSSYLSNLKIQELYQSLFEQGGLIYKIRIIIEGQLFKIIASTEEQLYTRVLEMMKNDGILLIRNVFQNDYKKLLENLQITDKILIKGIELIETHGNLG